MNMIGDAEKPLTETLKQVAALIADIRAKGLTLTVNGIIITIRVTA